MLLNDLILLRKIVRDTIIFMRKAMLVLKRERRVRICIIHISMEINQCSFQLKNFISNGHFIDHFYCLRQNLEFQETSYYLLNLNEYILLFMFNYIQFFHPESKLHENWMSNCYHVYKVSIQWCHQAIKPKQIITMCLQKHLRKALFQSITH